MSPTVPTLWLHVSTLMKWDRPPVGIIRVEREYCLWLLGQARSAGQPVRFCVYDRPSRRFAEVALDQVEIKLGLREAPMAPPVRLPAWKRAIKFCWRAAKAVVPPSWSAAAARAFRLRYHHYVTTRRGPKVSPPPSAPILHGDRWVSLGADWEYLDLEVLYALKLQLGLRVTLICYDTIPVLLPQFFAEVLSPGHFGAYLVDLAWCADAVLCISQCTERDLRTVLSRAGGPSPATHVIRLGADISKTSGGLDLADVPAIAADQRPFVLYVSTIERRKNHEVLYRAWARIRERGIVPHRLVFVGMKGWGVDDLMADLRLDPRVRDDIVILNHVSDAQLGWLYRHAAFTVFPSLYEGWGLPVVESLAWGKFCLASSAASLPEAGGPWAEYLDPWDLPAWAARLEHYMGRPEEVAALNRRIAQEYQAPAWADTAATIHRIAMGGAVEATQ